MGSGALGSQEDAYQDPTYFTALFTIQDPVANRRIVGVGRINLSKRTVDFAPLGPAPDDLRLSFAVSPDHKRGYILAQAVDDYQLWLVDIDKRRVEKKIPFEGRPRMAIQVSTSGQVLYSDYAGRTIDLYDVSDFKHLADHHDGNRYALQLVSCRAISTPRVVIRTVTRRRHGPVRSSALCRCSSAWPRWWSSAALFRGRRVRNAAARAFRAVRDSPTRRWINKGFRLRTPTIRRTAGAVTRPTIKDASEGSPSCE